MHCAAVCVDIDLCHCASVEAICLFSQLGWWLGISVKSVGLSYLENEPILCTFEIACVTGDIQSEGKLLPIVNRCTSTLFCNGIVVVRKTWQISSPVVAESTEHFTCNFCKQMFGPSSSNLRRLNVPRSPISNCITQDGKTGYCIIYCNLFSNEMIARQRLCLIILTRWLLAASKFSRCRKPTFLISVISSSNPV